MGFLDSINDTLGWYVGSAHQPGGIGSVNLITPEELKRKRNRQLIISILIIAIIISTIYYFTNKNKPKR